MSCICPSWNLGVGRLWKVCTDWLFSFRKSGQKKEVGFLGLHFRRSLRPFIHAYQQKKKKNDMFHSRREQSDVDLVGGWD